MKLVQDWQWFLRKAWSVRLAVIAGLLSGASAILPMWIDEIPRTQFALLSMVFAIGAAVATIVAQPRMERRATPRRNHKGEVND